MNNDKLHSFFLVLLFTLDMLLVMFSIIGNRYQVEKLEGMQDQVNYLQMQCEQLQQQNNRQQRQMDQDFLILTEGWKE